jgi:hypothetical protein
VSHLFLLFACWLGLFGIHSQFCFTFWVFSGLRTALGNSATKAQAVQTAYNSSQ